MIFQPYFPNICRSRSQCVRSCLNFRTVRAAKLPETSGRTFWQRSTSNVGAIQSIQLVELRVEDHVLQVGGVFSFVEMCALY